MEEYLDESLGLDSLVTNYNKLGMDSLNAGQFNSAMDSLHRANQLLQHRALPGSEIKLKAMTLNNLGCLYKRLEQFPKALTYLTEALELERQLGTDGLSMAATHLNICAIRSSMGQHEAALAHAQRALTLLSPLDSSASIATMVVIAYNNAANQQEFLGEIREASTLYYEGWQYAVEHLGRQHELANAMFMACQQASYQKSPKVKYGGLPTIPDVVHRPPKKPKGRPAQDLVTFVQEPRKKERVWKPPGIAKPTPGPLVQSTERLKNEASSPRLEKPRSRLSRKMNSRMSSTQRAYSGLSPLNFDNRIHFIGDKIVDLQKRMSIFEESLTDEKPDSRQTFAFYSKRRQAAASKIQGYWKAGSVRRFLLRSKAAAARIQRCFRGSIGRKEFEQTKMVLGNASVIVQTSFKAWITRKRINKLKACVRIQKCFKAWRVYKRTKKMMNCMRIQKAFKMWIAFRKKEKERNCFVIEKWFRTRIQAVFKKKNLTSRTIQTAFRGIEAWRFKTGLLGDVVLIQTWLRATSSRITYQNTSDTRTHMSITGQKLYRGNRGRKDFQAYKLMANRSCLVIQSVLRKVIHAHEYEALRIQRSKGQVIIMRWYKGWKARKHYRDLQKQANHLALLLQTQFRHKISRKFFENTFDKRSRSALVIQKHRRRCVGTDRFYFYKSIVDQASTLIQSVAKQFMYKKFFKTELLDKSKASLVIQKEYRRKKALEYYLEHRNRTNHLCKIIQVKYRGFCGDIAYTKMRLEQTKASVFVQKLYRSYTIRKTTAKHKEVLKGSTLTFVKCFRSFLSKQFYKKVKYYRDSMALLVQKNFRAYWAHKKYKNMKESAVKIQAFFRGCRDRNHFRQLNSFLNELNIINEILSESSRPPSSVNFPTPFYKTWLPDKSSAPSNGLRNSYNTQNYQKSIYPQPSREISYEEPTFSIPSNGSSVPKPINRPSPNEKGFQRPLKHFKEVADTLGKPTKSIKVNRKPKNMTSGPPIFNLPYDTTPKATHRTRPDSIYNAGKVPTGNKRRETPKRRTPVSRQRVQKLPIPRNDPVLEIPEEYLKDFVDPSFKRQSQSPAQFNVPKPMQQSQTKPKNSTQRTPFAKDRTLKIDKSSEEDSEPRVQPYVHLSEGKFLTVNDQNLHCSGHDHMCVRCFKIIVNYPPKDFSQQLTHDILKQDVAVHNLIKKNKDELDYSEDTKAKVNSVLRKVTRAQSLVRGYLARNSYKRERSVKLIQKAVRRFKERSKLLKNRAASKIQSHYKKYVTREKYLKLIGLIRIQKAFRAFYLRQIYNRLVSAIKIQAVFKGRIQRNRFKEFKAAKQIQRYVRGYFQRKRFKELKAARVIQKNVRAYFHKKKIWYRKCLLKLQALARGIHDRKKVRILKKCILLQKCIRSFIWKKTIKKERAAVDIQKAIRGVIHKKHIRPIMYSRRILFATKSFLMRKHCAFELAIKRIQVRFRAFLATHEDSEKAREQNEFLRNLQNVLRGGIDRIHTRRKIACTLIQSKFRSFYQNAMTVKRAKAAITIQKAYRKFDTQVKFLETKAVINIQKILRKFVSNVNFIEFRNAITIQKAFRSFDICLFFEKTKAAIVIQKYYRAYSTRALFLEIKEAATVIQKNFRGYRVRYVYNYIKRSVFFIQCYWRMYRYQKYEAQYRRIKERGEYQSRRLWN